MRPSRQEWLTTLCTFQVSTPQLRLPSTTATVHKKNYVGRSEWADIHGENTVTGGVYLPTYLPTQFQKTVTSHSDSVGDPEKHLPVYRRQTTDTLGIQQLSLTTQPKQLPHHRKPAPAWSTAVRKWPPSVPTSHIPQCAPPLDKREKRRTKTCRDCTQPPPQK